MRFSRRDAHRILTGRKTEHAVATEPRVRVGRAYAVQVGRHAAMAAVRVRKVREVRGTAQVTAQDAWRQGFKRLHEFEEWWSSQHPNHSGKLWVIEFALVTEAPMRLLHRDSSRGYTDRPDKALFDEPEAIDRETQNAYSGVVREREIEDARRRRSRQRAGRKKSKRWDRAA
jgi:hypothetical protein